MVSKLKNINSNEIIPGFKGKFIHGKEMTLAFWNVKKGSSVPAHNHIHEQTLYVKKGIFELEINNEKNCLLYTSPSPRDRTRSRMPSSA